jgi:TolA-binding protein
MIRYLIYLATITILAPPVGYKSSVFAAEKKPIASKREPKKNIRILSFKDKKKAQEIRAKIIRSIRELIESTKDDGKRYELLRRYGELYAEQAEYALEKEMLTYDLEYKRWEKTKKGDVPKVKTENSKLSLQKAVEIYRKIVAKYPTYAGIDVTYYELGKNLLRLENKEGVTYLKKLVKEQPKSAYIPEALFALGEHYFDTHDMVEARKYYNEAAKNNTHSIYPYAVYKLGWTYYNFPAQTPEEEQEKFKKAVTAFKLVIKLSLSIKDEDGRAIYLREEAINDLIMVWSETEDIDAAWDYFKQIGNQEAFYRMLERLGDIYIEQGAREKAIAVLTRILKEVPNRESSPESHTKLVKIYGDSMKWDLAVKQSQLLTKLYLKNGKWTKNFKDKPEVLLNAENSVESTIHLYATKIHQDAQKGKYKEMFRASAQLYLLYLKSFPKNPKSYELRYFLADCLFELKRFDDAATQFSLVARQNEKDGKYLQDAAMNAVISMNAVVTAKKFAEVEKPGTLKKPLEIPAEKKKLQSALDYYAKIFPNKADTKAMLVTAAKISFEYGHYQDSIDRYTKIALSYPNTKQSEEGVNVVLSFYKDRKDWDQVIKYCKIFLGTKGVVTGELQQNTQKLLVFASFERALAFEKNNKPIEAAEAFVQFQVDFPKESNASTALYNAMVIYFKNGLVEKALDSAKLVLTAYPQFDRRSDVIMTVAETYEGLGDFSNASHFFAVFAKQYSKDKRAAETLYGAAILAKGAGADKDTIQHMNSFISSYPGHKLELAASLEIAEAHERLKDSAGAIKAYQSIQTKFPANLDESLLARAKIIRLSTGSKQPDPIELAKLQKSLTQKGAPAAVEARHLVSESLFSIEESNYRKFLDSKINTSNLEAGIQAKQAELVKLAKAYQDIIAIGDGEYVVGSSYKLGQANEAFALALTAIRLPPSLDEKTRTEVSKTLGEISDNLKKEAYGFYSNTFAATIKEKIFSDWGNKAYERMSVLEPAKSPPLREFTVDPGYSSHSLDFDNTVATMLH